MKCPTVPVVGVNCLSLIASQVVDVAEHPASIGRSKLTVERDACSACRTEYAEQRNATAGAQLRP